jgi:hypothetical protein
MDDSGQAIVIVLIVSAMLLAALVVALTATRAGVNEAIGFKANSQAGMAAQTGLATGLTAMRADTSAATSYSALPCSLPAGSLNVTGARSTYSTTVAYYSASGAVLTCAEAQAAGGTTGLAATLTSTGKAPQGSVAVMKEDVTIAPAASTSAAVGDGIFTASTLNLDNGNDIVQGSTGASTLPTEYADGVVTCDTSHNLANLITYAAMTLANNCSYTGNLTVDGAVAIAGGSTVGGSVIAYGAGITLSNGATIGSNATATGGAILFNSSGHVGGSAYASGTISETNGSPTLSSYISGGVYPNDTSLSSETMPAEVSFPTLSLPTTQTTPVWNIVNIPNSQYSCATYFSDFQSIIPDPFQQALESQTERTLYNAPSCPVSYGTARKFMLNPSTAGDAILDVASLVLYNAGSTFCEESAAGSDTCSSATTPGPNLTVFANASSASSTCSTSTESTTAVQVSNSTFDSNVVTLIYSLGGVSFQNGGNLSMTGQIIACGNITATGTFILTVNTAAATEVLGSSTTSAGLTLTDEDKYVVSG